MSIEFGKLSFKILSESDYLKDFSCGETRYDNFITNEALEHQIEKLGTTYLFYCKDECVGYVTIAMGDLNKAKHTRLKGMTQHDNIPGLFLAQMARSKQYEGKGLGSHLVHWVIARAYTISQEIGCRIVFLECEDKLVDFYKKNGYEPIPRRRKDKRNVMFIDLFA